jgi:hypothetical protein
MILYQLRCQKAHDFEAWFLNGDTYERQAASGDVACPYCGTTTVGKAPMAPRIASSAGESLIPAAGGPEARAEEVAAKILEAVEGIRAHVEETCENVGQDFPDEARRIHQGKAKDRGIYGEAKESEAEKLSDEGIDVFRLPFGRRPRKN